MKQWRSILLLLVLLAPFAGSYSLLQYKKHQLWEEIKRKALCGLDREELRLLRFTRQEAEAELHWERPGEFKYQGQWYDVVERSEAGDTLYFWCWWDYEETRIGRQLEQLTARALGSDAQHQENALRLTVFIQSLGPPEPGLYLNIPRANPKGRPHALCRRWLNLSFPPPSPPPRV